MPFRQRVLLCDVRKVAEGWTNGKLFSIPVVTLRQRTADSCQAALSVSPARWTATMNTPPHLRRVIDRDTRPQSVTATKGDRGA